MSNFEFYYKMAYRRARNESQIHWHREDPPELLKDAIRSLGGSGKALDIGCGTGVNSVFMALQGFAVTAVDFVPRAIEFAKMRSERYGVNINFVQGDILKFETKNKFNLIIDSGCFHGFDGTARIEYKRKLLTWLDLREGLGRKPEYILVHFGKKNFFDLSLVGPRKRTKSEVEEFFAPELNLVDFRPSTNGMPLFQYRFRTEDVRSATPDARSC
jgi:SAM-dependent methyltransferase